MAAVTAASIYEESMGSNTLYIINFTSIDTSTYVNANLAATAIGYWANGLSGVSVFVSGTTFSMLANAAGAAQLYVVARQM